MRPKSPKGKKDGANPYNSKQMGLFDKIFGSEETKQEVNELKMTCRKYEACQTSLKRKAGELYNKRKGYLTELLSIKKQLSSLQNLPAWCSEDIDSAIEQVKDFRTAVEYENNPKKFAENTDQTGRTAAFIKAGTPAGTAIAKLGPSVAMSIATLLGTVSTGTSISALSGVAATNAALTWLGTGAFAAGGSALAGGSLLLGMFGPIGTAIGAVSAVGGIMFMNSKNKENRAEIEKNIDTIKRDIQTIEPKLNKLSELIARSDSNHQKRLRPMLLWMKSVLPRDYSQWDDDKKHSLEKLVNAISSTAQLINERI